ncbi:MAG: hypothetical protein HUU35_02270, partial [Armatimonadetes bacterium]|nr:hypothetical protein [Armatimonadota bacterium]
MSPAIIALLTTLAPFAAALDIQAGQDGTLTLNDGQPLGRLAVVAWDAAWKNATTNGLKGEGSLADGLSLSFDLPGAAAGEARLVELLSSAAGLHRLMVEATFSQSTTLNAFSVQLDLPVARLLSRAVRSADGRTRLSIGEGRAGGQLPGLAVVELADDQALVFGFAGGGPLEVVDNRQFGSPTIGLRATLARGAITAGQRVKRALLLAQVPAAELPSLLTKLAAPASFDPARPALLANASGTLSLLAPGGRRAGELALAVHGRNWQLRQQADEAPPSGDIEATQRSYAGALAVPGGGQIAYESAVSPTPTGFRLAYQLRRDQPVEVNSHQLSLSLPLDGLLGRQVTLVGEQQTTVTVPAEHDAVHLARQQAREVRLWPEQPNGLVIQVDPPTSVLIQDNRAFGSNLLEVRFELGGDMQAPLPAGQVALNLEFVPSTPVQVVLDADGARQTTDTSNWFAWSMPWDAAPVDLSFLNHKPAGCRGFVRREGERFLFEDGSEARFWGTCFSAGANFPTHEQAELIARRLARFGVNIVRTHHADADWSNPSFFRFGEQRSPTTTEFVPESLDRFDYLIYCLEREGIYIYLDQLVHRKFTAADGVASADKLENAAKPYSNFDPKLIEVQKEFSRKLLEHVNPYTKKAYKDDPGIVLMEFANENDLMTQRVELEPYRSQLEARYRTWARGQGIEVPAGAVRFDLGQTPVLRFLVEVQADYYREMTRFMRELGVKIPLTGSNWSRNAGLLAALEVVDFTDSHAYHDHPGRDGSFQNSAHLGQVGTMLQTLSFNRLVGKPFFVSEWDTPWPNEWRAELPLWIAAIAALQQWNGLTVYTYRHSAEPTDILSGSFETFNDPCRFGLFPAAALIYRRGDVAAARETVTVHLPRQRALTAPSPGSGLRALELTPEV